MVADKLKFSRASAQASAWTFTIPPVAALLDRYVGSGQGWADPFAGRNSPAEFTNDHDMAACARSQMDAADFADVMVAGLAGVLFDPPYSPRQIKEHYKRVGLPLTQADTSANFYYRVIDRMAPKIRVGGYAISFGWNSNGFGKQNGFHLVEILLVAHGSRHNDTIVTVEQKVQAEMFGEK